MPLDPIAVIEAAYEPVLDEAQWMQGIAAAADPALDKGFGVCAFAFDATTPGKLRFSSPVLTGPMADQAPLLDQLFTHIADAMPADLRDTFFRAQDPFQTVSKELGVGSQLVDNPIFRGFLQGLGIFDSTIVRATDPTRRGVCISAAMPQIAAPAKKDAALWNRLAAHLAAGFRLRHGPAQVDAILDVDGKAQHLEPTAQAEGDREALADAARRIDRARGKLRRLDPIEAVSLWQALAASKWSLVDQFDHDGRRYLVARRNHPLARAAANLSENERTVLEWASLGHSKKLIGYELGISPATVSNRLSRAARKLGARNRLEAAREFRKQGHLAPPAPAGLAAAEIETPEEGLAIVGFSSAAASLTEAEREVLLAVVQGQSNESIASARGVALRTIANQVAALFKKLGVGSRAELGTRWLEVLQR